MNQQITPEIQKAINDAILSKRIMNYGREVVEIEGKMFRKDTFMNKSDLKFASDFKELEQGCELWFEGEKYPMRCSFQRDRHNVVHQFKRAIPAFLRTFNGNIFKKLVAAIYFKQNWSELLDFLHYGMSNSFMLPKYYAPPIAEIYKWIRDERIRDVVCAILEWDDGYRYPFQDVISELDKELFKKDPIQEIKRIYEIYVKRATLDFNLSKGFDTKYIFWALKLNPKILKEIEYFVENVNLDNLKLSKEDWYWCCSPGKKGYNFKDLSYEERQKIYNSQKNG